MSASAIIVARTSASLSLLCIGFLVSIYIIRQPNFEAAQTSR
jgi:hypothetical protein